MGALHVGTCSWTEKSMVDLWYPRGVYSAEARLRYYARKFDTVEVDSSFYALPIRSNAEKWAQRTPSDFTFHVKAYGMMTRHEVEASSLPPELREFPYEMARGRVRDPHPAMVDAAFDMFVSALEPLRDAGKLGGVLMQFPPDFAARTPKEEARNLEYVEYAREKLGGLRMLVEFRHPSWVRPDRAQRTLQWLGDRGLAYVSVDAPQFPERSTMPPLAAVTTDWAYVRLHGRNASTWFGKHESSADRFDYLYTTHELKEWEPRIRHLARDAKQTFVLFNNNKKDYAQRNAKEIATILGDLVPRRAPNPTSDAPTLF
jgi:uncharacterized protein YecE (DUF72 family)